MFVMPRPRMLVERVQFALVEQLVVGRLMTAEVEPEQLARSGRSCMLALKSTLFLVYLQYLGHSKNPTDDDDY